MRPPWRSHVFTAVPGQGLELECVIAPTPPIEKLDQSKPSMAEIMAEMAFYGLFLKQPL